MTTYAIGSVNGHYQPLLTLLEKIQFEPEQDCLWFTGNLINPGPDPLAVLRFVKGLGKSAVTILGRQELNLIAAAEGGGNDAMADILAAPDRDELVKWLRRRALLHHDPKLNFTLVHAGIHADWTLSKALTLAYEVESALPQGNYRALFDPPEPDQSRWHPKLRGWKRLRFIANAYTLMKYCNAQGKLDFYSHGAIGTLSQELVPWYRLPERMAAELNIIFADVAGFQDENIPGIYPLAEQGQISALKLSTNPESFSVDY